MLVRLVLGTTALLVLVAAVLALRVIRVTKFRWAWVLLSAALFLVAARRIAELVAVLFGDGGSDPSLGSALLVLAIAVIGLAGVCWMPSLFRKMREEQSLVSAIVDTVGALVVVLDRDGRIVRFNHACEAATAYRADEVRGRFVWEIFIPAEQIEAVKGAFAALRAGNFPNTFENHWLDRDGNRRLIAWSNTALVRPDGSVEYVIGTGIDITEKRTAEEALRSSEERYRSLVQNAVIGIYRTDLAGRFLQVNPAFASMLGFVSPVDLEELNVRELYVEPERRERLVRALRESERVDGLEVVWKRRDGKPMTVQLTGRCLRSADGQLTGFEMFAEDVTTRRRLEVELRHAQKMEAIGRLTGGIAHDFNNLLTVINGYGETLLAQLERDHDFREPLIQIRHAGMQAASLVRQLLAFSKKQVLAPRVVDLNPVVNEMERMLGRVIGEHISLETILEPDLFRVRVDPGQIQQVIMNLSVNARDAMPDGGRLTIETSNVVLGEDEAGLHVGLSAGPHVLLTVSDTGTGMDEETRARIFEPFFTTKGRERGTGLGLSTVYGILDQSGGSIQVRSAPGEGSSFRIWFPRCDDASEERPIHAELAATPTGWETVLVVEDEAGVRDLVRELLAENGYRVLAAENGAKALAILDTQDEPIHLLLTDVVMPGMSGPDLALELRRRMPGLPLIFMSGYAGEDRLPKEILEKSGAYIQKPFTPGDLAWRVREVLDSA